MNNITIKEETVKRSKRRIWGQFILSDGSVTKFDGSKENSWEQWGNTTDNLRVTVSRLEEIFSEWLLD